MDETSTNLNLPYLQAAQAQKHVTHNAALERLDLVVHLVLQGFDETSPPLSPDEGQVWSIGSGAINDWVGHDGELAAWSNGGWLFLTPKAGWRSVVGTELRLWNGSAWVAPDLPALQNLSGVGIGTTYDATNKLAVASDAVLLSHAGAGHQLKVNKNGVSDTASVLFQTGWSGRAELGTLGSEAFGVKVSADGSSWTTALSINAATGVPAFGHGAVVNGPVTGTGVTQSPTDATVGRLTKVGDFGLGSTSGQILVDLNDNTVPNGLYFCVQGTTANNTVGGIAFTGSVLVNQRANGARVTQIAIFEGLSNGLAFIRVYNGGWGPWYRTYNQATILGAVSQSGGVPTGAILQRGVNANGEFVRFADGTQICTVSAAAVDCQVTAGTVFTHASALVWTFPAAFSAAPSVSGGGGDVTRWLATSTPSPSAVGYRVLSHSSSASLAAPVLMAVGRWF
ncbi:DUF2793 domain-containing protein [Pararhodobacter sp. CCB-MM2]|uniref:DUF2793 domain-containing protein n=1 Tax=Pararhodobacter sp. CCB-MM2 TaxID=1786003 RepID=UPI00082CA19A|nr:DUF2793 domain-containing protein [Pararhodobacter sp. CCB-MM2]